MGIAIRVHDLSFKDKNLGKVTVSEKKELVSISIDSEDTIEASTYQLKIVYNPSNTAYRGVEWSIVSGGEYASIDNSGLLSINDGVEGKEIVVKAISVSNPSITATKNVTVTFMEVEGTEKWYIDNITGHESKYLERMSAFSLPWYIHSTPETIGVKINAIKTMIERTGNVTLAVYNDSQKTVVKELGTYDVYNGTNTIKLNETIYLEDGQTIGVKDSTTNTYIISDTDYTSEMYPKGGVATNSFNSQWCIPFAFGYIV